MLASNSCTTGVHPVQTLSVAWHHQSPSKSPTWAVSPHRSQRPRTFSQLHASSSIPSACQSTFVASAPSRMHGYSNAAATVNLSPPHARQRKSLVVLGDGSLGVGARRVGISRPQEMQMARIWESMGLRNPILLPISVGSRKSSHIEKVRDCSSGQQRHRTTSSAWLAIEPLHVAASHGRSTP